MPGRLPIHSRGTLGCLLAVLLLLSPIPSQPSARADNREVQPDVVDMSPGGGVSWSLRHLTAPLISALRGPDHMYAPREIKIETTPPGGYLDLFYVRAGFQKRFEQAEAPVIVRIPARVEVGSRDSMTIRAFAEGYRQQKRTFRLTEDIRSVMLDLTPLPNRLIGISFLYFAGRSELSFMTDEALTFRFQESADGYGVILLETGISDSAGLGIQEIESPRLSGAYAEQLGDDLMVKLQLRESAAAQKVDVRSRQLYDAPRDLHVFSIDLIHPSPDEDRSERALEVLAAVSGSDLGGCAGVFDAALRAALDPQDLARALRPRGAFTDPYLRAAMRRLGELSVDQVVDFVDGSQLRPSSPIELEMAMSNASQARGYLVLLREFVEGLERDRKGRELALRSLLAPELSSSQFQERLALARAGEERCRDGT
jgi:hypothetical protein